MALMTISPFVINGWRLALVSCFADWLAFVSLGVPIFIWIVVGGGCGLAGWLLLSLCGSLVVVLSCELTEFAVSRKKTIVTARKQAHNDSMKQPEYTEGTQALENFKQLASAILQAPAKKKNRRTKKSASPSKPKKSDRN